MVESDKQVKQVDVTLSIVSTNNRDLLRQFLNSINATVRKTTYEIIVVDNASTDGTFEMLDREYPKVKVIKNSHREGYGNCHNHAIKEAVGEYVLVLNEDMEMVGDAVDRMVMKAREIDNLGVLGCKILNPDMSLQHSCFKFPTLSQELFEALFPYSVIFSESHVRRKMYYWCHDTQRDVDVVLGCCMLIPRKAIDVVGIFDPSFFIYSEEDDLCKRMHDMGLRVVFTPEAEMIHFGGQTSKHMSLKMAIIQLDSRIRYFYKHRGILASLIFRAILGIAIGLRLAGWTVINLFPIRRKNNVTAKLHEYLASTKLIFTWKK
jgi:GT2 family glycosyltransferase